MLRPPSRYPSTDAWNRRSPQSRLQGGAVVEMAAGDGAAGPQPGHGALEADGAAPGTGAGPEVDHVVGDGDRAAIVLNTSELLPEPETPVNTVSRRFGSSTLTSLRLLTRAPCTRIRSWRSATPSARACVSVLVAMLIVSPQC